MALDWSVERLDPALMFQDLKAGYAAIDSSSIARSRLVDWISPAVLHDAST
jgi:hypothetical protein